MSKADKNKKSMLESKSSEQDEEPVELADGKLTFFLFLLFIAICVLAWFLTAKAAITGAPGAPTG